ncbi:hypothetical protein ACFL21_01445 [Patescibacteria group bacterium]
MTYIITAVVIFLGIVVFSFVISNIILILFFAIPITKKLERISLLKNNNIISSYIVALLIEIIIFSVVTIIFYIYFTDSYFISLLVGFGFGLIGIITQIKKFGLNMNNFSDYFEKNKSYFWEELVNKYETNPEELLKFIRVALKKQNLSK